MKPPPSFTTWEPAADGTRVRRPTHDTTPAKPEEPERFRGVAYESCRVCGWRFSKYPTRCNCPGAVERTAKPLPDRFTEED